MPSVPAAPSATCTTPEPPPLPRKSPKPSRPLVSATPWRPRSPASVTPLTLRSVKPASWLPGDLVTGDSRSDAYTSVEVCRIVGITYRQLDWALRAQKIPCSYPSLGHGHPRRFTDDDVQAIRVHFAPS